MIYKEAVKKNIKLDIEISLNLAVDKFTLKEINDGIKGHLIE